MAPTLKSYVGIGVPGPRGPAGPAGGADLGFSTKEELETRVIELVQENAPEPAALAEVVQAVETLQTEAVKSINGQAPDQSGNVTISTGGSAAPVIRPGSATLVLDEPVQMYGAFTITGPTTINVSSTLHGAYASAEFVANGTNTPTLAGVSELNSSMGYDPIAQTRNFLQIENRSGLLVAAWSQLAVNAPAPAPGVVPGAPATFTAGTATQTSQPLSWSAPATGSPASYTYSIAYRVNGSGSFPSPQLTGLTGTSTTVSGLTAGTAYDYQITATNTSGTGPAASITNASTAAAAPPPGPGEDAIIADYRTAMAADGRTVNETHVGRADTAVKALRAAGLLSKLSALNLAMGDVLADTFVPLIGPKAASVGTVGYDPALGWSTDGTSGRISTNVQAVAGNWGMGAYLRTAQASDATARPLIGTSSTTDNYRIIGNRIPGVASGSANGAVSNLHGTSTATLPDTVGYASTAAGSGGLSAGAWTEIRRSSTNTELIQNGTSRALNTTTVNVGGTDVPANVPITVMALNGGSGTPVAYLAAGSRVAGYWRTDGTMTQAEIFTLHSIIQTYQTDMGRAV